MKTIEYATIEWLWNAGHIRLNYGSTKQEEKSTGMYDEVVDLLNKLGREGWEVATSVSGTNWIFWTLKREYSPNRAV